MRSDCGLPMEDDKRALKSMRWYAASAAVFWYGQIQNAHMCRVELSISAPSKSIASHPQLQRSGYEGLCRWRMDALLGDGDVL